MEKPQDNQIPPPPDKPTPYECCETGCSPCIFDYYYEALAEWESKYGSLKDYYAIKEQN